MKKILISSVLFFMLLTGCSLKEVNVDIIDLETTKLSFELDSNTFSEDSIEELRRNKFDVVENYEEIIISTDINNISFGKNINEKYASFLKIMSEYDVEIYNELKSKKISFESSFGGFPFGAVSMVTMKNSNIPSGIKVNVNAQGIASFNDGEFLERQTIDSQSFKDKNTFIYNLTAANSVVISIKPNKDYRKIEAIYEINSDKEVFKTITEQDLYEEGFFIVSQSDKNLIISKTFQNSDEFNIAFNLDLINIFSIVGKIDIELKNDVFEKININGTMLASDLIKNVTLKVILPKEGIDKVSGIEAKSFQWDVENKINMEINSSNINIFKVVSALGTTFIIGFVIYAIVIFFKKFKR